MKQLRQIEEICSDRERCLSKMKPRLRAVEDGRIVVSVLDEKEGIEIFANFMKSDKKEFSYRRIKGEQVGSHAVRDISK